MNKVYTVTFGDVAENHARMQQIGTLANAGYSVEKLRQLAETLSAKGVVCELIDLAQKWEGEGEVVEAAVLVIRKGVQFILGEDDTSDVMAEHDVLDMDQHALMRGRVVNKHARWNLCFDDNDQEPDYAAGKGRIVAYRHIPLTHRIRNAVQQWMGDDQLKGEANYYYDVEKCGIGYHGDSERKKVVAFRMGGGMSLYYQWFQNSEPVGKRICVELEDGDMYAMSEKAVGFDWHKKIIPTLRHATGCDKYTVIVK